MRQKGRDLTLNYREMRILRALLRGDTALGRHLAQREISSREMVLRNPEYFQKKRYGKREITLFAKFPEAKALINETAERDRRAETAELERYRAEEDAQEAKALRILQSYQTRECPEKAYWEWKWDDLQKILEEKQNKNNNNNNNNNKNDKGNPS